MLKSFSVTAFSSEAFLPYVKRKIWQSNAADFSKIELENAPRVGGKNSRLAYVNDKTISLLDRDLRDLCLKEPCSHGCINAKTS